ncbi:MAG TPA: Type 1 glutamine amidotransferase-like domain-containing protein [Nitrososphaerales archaeon]|nr:Type 1 glutamine amidotransferase-like domain-containing protein [Nitrososphaerales archaeon]
MKFLLTSAGVFNKSIRDALVDLLGKPIAESSALFIPTGSYGFMPGGIYGAYQMIHGVAKTPLCELGWKSLGVLELTALPSIKKESWVPEIERTDALLVGGGYAPYLCYWMRQSGLADLLPTLRHEAVYVGVSAGSMAATPSFGEPSWWIANYNARNPPTAESEALGLVDFSLLPHMDNIGMPDNSMANFEKLAAKIPVPTYAIDDQTAIKVTDGKIEVVSEGHWKRFTPL